eukprot:gene34425-57190_t
MAPNVKHVFGRETVSQVLEAPKVGAGGLFDLTGKVAVITGSSRGIGRAIALKLSQAGARVVINHLNQPQEAATLVQAIKAAGGLAVAISADVSDG